MGTFYTPEELKELGIKEFGENVKISRNAMLYHPEKLVLGHDVRIDDFTVISGNVRLHNYVHLSQFCGLYGDEAGIEIEDYTAVAAKCSIYAVSDDYVGPSVPTPMVPMKYKTTMIKEPVHIGKYSILGVNTVVLPGVTIGEGTTVGAMSLCNKNLDTCSVYAGIPARKLKDRDKKVADLVKEFEGERSETES